jgi:hypothetical protein
MKTLLVSAAVLGLTATGSLAADRGPLTLTNTQMDYVTAGQLIDLSQTQIAVAIPVNANVGVCAIAETCGPVTTNPDQRIRIINRNRRVGGPG